MARRLETTLLEIGLLPELPCDCCGGHFRDEVGELMVVDAIVSYAEALLEHRDEERSAFADAFSQIDEARAQLRQERAQARGGAGR